MRSGGRFLLAICLLAPLLAACETAPVTGRSQLMLVSENEERQMGEQAYNQLLSREPQIRDGGWATTTVDRVGRRIADAAENPPGKLWKAPYYDWEFRTINKNVVNAFCLPGGKIAVYTGLLQVVQSDAELAAVLGHEVAHALARHSAERLSDQRAATVALTAASVALAVLGARSGTISPGTSAALSVAALAAGAGVTYGVLGGHADGCRLVVDGRQPGARAAIVGAAFDADRALADGRQDLFLGHRRADMRHAEALQASQRQQRRFDHTGFALGQAGVDIAAQVHDLEVGPQMQQLRAIGGLLTVRATDPAAEQDFPAYCRQTGHQLVSATREGDVLVFVIRKNA